MLKENIATFYPQAMKSLPNWVLWRLESKDGRKTKVPYSPLYDDFSDSAKHARTNDPSTWTTFDIAQKRLQEDNTFSGLGFVFSEDTKLVFVDIDHCINNGILNSVAVDILQTIGKDTYIELSQSGTGLHIFAYGEIPKTIKRDIVEMYSHGRYVAMTGKALSPCEPSDKHNELLKVYEKYKPFERPSRPRIETETKLTLSDNEIIERASSSRYGDTFRKLMSGDISGYPSHSEADLKLCQTLAFWSDRDFDTIERIFTSSGLCREKWIKRPRYREQTITRACNSINESISEMIARKKSEEDSHFETISKTGGGI